MRVMFHETFVDLFNTQQLELVVIAEYQDDKRMKYVNENYQYVITINLEYDVDGNPIDIFSNIGILGNESELTTDLLINTLYDFDCMVDLFKFLVKYKFSFEFNIK